MKAFHVWYKVASIVPHVLEVQWTLKQTTSHKEFVRENSFLSHRFETHPPVRKGKRQGATVKECAGRNHNSSQSCLAALNKLSDVLCKEGVQVPNDLEEHWTSKQRALYKKFVRENRAPSKRFRTKLCILQASLWRSETKRGSPDTGRETALRCMLLVNRTTALKNVSLHLRMPANPSLLQRRGGTDCAGYFATKASNIKQGVCERL